MQISPLPPFRLRLLLKKTTEASSFQVIPSGGVSQQHLFLSQHKQNIRFVWTWGQREKQLIMLTLGVSTFLTQSSSEAQWLGQTRVVDCSLARQSAEQQPGGYQVKGGESVVWDLRQLQYVCYHHEFAYSGGEQNPISHQKCIQIRNSKFGFGSWQLGVWIWNVDNSCN